MKRILIDGRFVGIGESISRYTLELTKGILALDKENQYTLLIRPQGVARTVSFFDIAKTEIDLLIANGKLKKGNIEIHILDIKHYSIAEQTKFLSYLNKEKFDLVHFIQFNHPVFYHGNYVVTIHDLTLVGHLHYFNFAKQLAYNLVMKSAAHDSRKIIAISKETEQDVIDYYGIAKSKFAVIYHGIDHDRYNIKTKNEQGKIKIFKQKYGIDGEYILYTGMWKKHKNLQRLFSAFEQFKKASGSPIQLVLTGKIDQNEPEVIAKIKEVNKSLSAADKSESEVETDSKVYSTNSSIVTTGFIDEDELPIAYAGALCYVIPSLSEGFGWPPLEAMACGTPVIASKESCIPEILGEAPLYFDPYDVKSISNTLNLIVSDASLREKLFQKGLIQAKKYHWDKTAEKTLKVYKECLK